MPEIYDDSLDGSITEIKSSYIESSKSNFKEGVEFRFRPNVDMRTLSDEPIMNYLKEKGDWASAREMIDALGMADRTVFNMCKKLTLHETIDMKVERIKEDGRNMKNTRLYRIPIKENNDPRANKEKNRGNKKTRKSHK